MGIPKLQIRPGNPDFLDLPWDGPIDNWDHGRLVSMPTGVHRHPVVFVAYDEGIYAIKEMPVRLAAREFEVLTTLQQRTHRAAIPAGLVERGWLHPQEEASAAVVTRFVENAFPYRRLVSGPGFGSRRSQMLDAMAGLLVELHLVGCYWGDCSLSNVLYRFDAGGIEAVMIDGETSEVHPTLSDGQRVQDLEIMKENLAGEMSDIAAMNELSLHDADLALGEDVLHRYQALWSELTEPLVISRDQGYRIRERIARLNSLGFSVHDINIEPTSSGDVVTMTTRVGGRTYNSNKLRELTGLEASENQARLLLGDLNYYLAKTGATSTTGKNVGVFKWLTSSFEPIVARVEQDWHGSDPVQGYCDFLNHRGALASARGADVPNEEAYASWVSTGFPGFPLKD
jgi:hypothetical protein